MVHPVFHPNFDDASVCIGDFWAPSESLGDLIVRIGRMIAYQEYKSKSPSNGLAAKWADENQHLLPVDSIEVAPPLDRTAPPPMPASAIAARIRQIRSHPRRADVRRDFSAR